MPEDGLVNGTLTGENKTDFTDIYSQSDPRRYFRVLSELEYQIPLRALPVFQGVLAASRRAGKNRTILDLCCSYGINSAFLLSAQDPRLIPGRYASPALGAMSASQVAEADSRLYGERRGDLDLTILGLDASLPAVGYATRAGLLDAGWAENLEDHNATDSLRNGIADVGLIISTGGVGYVGARTFEQLLSSVRAPEDLWLAIFVLRVFDYSPVVDVLESYGLVTERLEGTFRQRRFASAEEQEAAIHDVRSRGLDPAGKETGGWYHADCFLTRPAAAPRPL